MLIENIKDGDGVIKNMTEFLMVTFEKYWDQYGIMLSLEAILDLRMKLENLAFFFKKKKIDSLTWEPKLEKSRKFCTTYLVNIIIKV